MIVSRELALIAEAVSVNWTDDAAQDLRLEFKPGEYGLFSNAGKNALYLLPLADAREVKLPRKKSLAQAFRTFTARPADCAISITVPNDRTELKKIGYVLAIEYVSDKWTGKKTLYVHDYTTRVRFYADRLRLETAKNFGLLSQTGRTLVSPRGLIA